MNNYPKDYDGILTYCGKHEGFKPYNPDRPKKEINLKIRKEYQKKPTEGSN